MAKGGASVGRRIGRGATKALKWLAIVVGSLVSFVLVVVLVVLLLLQTDWGRSVALSVVLDQVNPMFQGELRAERLEGSIVSRIVLRGVTVLDPEGEVVASVDSVAVDFDLMTLLDERVHVRSAVVQGLALEVTDGEGRVGLARAFAPTEPTPEEPDTGPSPWTVQVDRAAILDSRVVQGPGEKAAALQDLDIEGAIRFREGVVSWEDLVVSARAVNVPADSLTLETTGSFGPERILLDRLKLELGDNIVLASGEVRDLEAPVVDLVIERVRVDLDMLARELPTLPVRGEVVLEGRVEGPITRLLVNLRAITTGGSITVEGMVGMPEHGGPVYDLAVVGRDIQPSAILTTFKSPIVADVEIRAQGAGNPMEEGEAAAQVRLTRIEGVPPLPLPVVVQANIAAGVVRAVVHAEGGQGERLDVAVDATLKDGVTADARLDIRGLDVPALAALVGIDGARGELRRLTGTATARIPEGGKPLVVADLQLGASRLHVPRSAGLEADVRSLAVRADVMWPGEGLPEGDVYVSVEGAAALGARVGDFELDAALVRVGDKGVRAEGRLEAQDVAYLEIASVQRVVAPFDVTWRGVEGAMPTGTADLTVVDARYEDIRLERANLDLALDEQGDALAVSGPVSVQGFAKGKDISLANLEGRIDAVRQPSGRIAGNVELDARRVGAGAGNKVARASVQARGSFVPGPSPRIDASGHLSVAGVQAGPDAAVAQASGTFNLKLRGGEPTGAVDLEARGVSLPERDLDTVSLTAHLGKGGKMRVQAEAEGGGARVELDVSGDLPTGRDKSIAARVNTLKLEGPAGGVELAPGATLRWSKGAGVEVDGLSLRGTGELPGRLDVDVKVDEMTGEIAGDIRIEALPVGRWLTTVSRIAGIEILPETEVAGTVDMTARLSGTVREPRGEMTLKLADARFGAMQGLDADLRASLEPKRARLAGVMTWVGDSRVRIDLTVPVELRFSPFEYQLLPDEPLAVHVSVASVDLADLSAFSPNVAKGEPLSGSLEARIDIDGTPERPLGIVQVDARSVSVGPMEDASAEVLVRFEDALTTGTVAVAEGGKKLLGVDMHVPANLVATFVGPQPVETLRKRLDVEPARLELNVADVRLGELPFTKDLSPELQSAIVGTDIRIEGTLDAPVIEGEIRISEMPVVQALASAKLRLETVDTDIRAHLTAATMHEQLLDGYLNIPQAASRILAGEDPMALLFDDKLVLNVVSSTLSAQTVADILPSVGLLMSNAVHDPAITFSLAVVGGEAGPSLKVVAQVQAVGERMPNRQQAIAHGITVSAEALPDRLTASVIADQGDGRGFLTMHANAAVGTAQLLDGGIAGTVALEGFATTRSFDLIGLARLYPAVFGPSVGMLTVDMTIGGTLGDPEVAGAVEMYFDELVLAVLGTKHENTKLRVELFGDDLHLEPIHWEQGGGAMDVTFDMKLPSFDAVDIEVTGQVKMDGYRLVDRTEARARLTGQVDVAGTAAEPVVSGTIRVDEAELNPMMGGRQVRAIGPPDDVVFGRANETQPAVEMAEVERKSGALGPVVSLSVEIPARSVWVHSDMLNVFAEGSLNIEIFGGVMSIEGIVTVVEGTAELYGRQFSIAEDSRVVFAGGTELDPRLAITATYDISAIDLSPLGLSTDDSSKIYVEVKGLASAPELLLRSDPPMDDTNIISVIVLGSPMGGGKENETAVEQQTLNLFVGLATGTITKLVQSELPVDVFKVEGGETLADAQITVGKRITRELLVMYQANLGSEQDENTNEILVDYSILQSLHLETRFGDAGQGAINLYYRWRY